MPRADLLDDQTRQRVSTLRNEIDRARHATGVLMARALAGRPVTHRPGRRPTVPGGGLYVSIAHAGRWVVTAVAREMVGVDVEPVESFAVPGGIARAILGEAESDRHAQSPARTAQHRLAQAWTAKEAVLKLTGYGLRADPRDVELDWRGGLRVCRLAFASEILHLLQLFDVSPDEGHVATLALAADRPVEIVPIDGEAVLRARLAAASAVDP